MVLQADTIKTVLSGHKRVIMAPGPVPAAVLLPLFEKNGRWHILFTKRAEHLNHHRGEISFPGGVCQPEDPSPLETALRETWEEVGIPPDQVNVLGVLDDAYSIYNYLVTPYVGIFPSTCTLMPNKAEIDRVIEIPLDHLCQPDIFRSENWAWQGRKQPVYFYAYKGEEVWGLTAAILKQFLELVFPKQHRHETIPNGSQAKNQEERCMTAS